MEPKLWTHKEVFENIMVVSLRKKRAAIWPYRLGIWSLLLLFFLLRGAHENPIAVDGELSLAEGLEITRAARSDILVVLDYEAIRQSGSTFRTRDFSVVWINLFEQEIGPVSIATPETLSAAQIEDSRITVLTSSVSGDLPPAILERLRTHVLEGNTLIVERPDGRVRELFSANGRAGVRRGQRFTHAEGLREPFAEELRRSPVFTEYIGSTAPKENSTTLLSIDGAPVVYATPFGEGTTITVEFNLGEHLVSLQQGRPDENFQLRELQNRPLPQTALLVADERLLGAPTPYADLLERFLLYGVIMHYAPTPAYWLFPGNHDGAVIFIHEDSRLGDGGGWMLEHETTYGASSTLVTTTDSGLTAEGAERIHRRGGEIGLAWRYPHPSVALYEPYGVGRFLPFRRPIPLEEQLAELRRTLPVNYVRSGRSLDGIWSQNWSEPLAALAEAGIRNDFSYETPGFRGFSFGTGLPFLAVNDQGMPLGIRVFPVISPSNADEGPSLEELLELSQSGHHQLLTIGTHPARFADYPDMEAFEAWLQTFELIQSKNHVIVNALRYDTFQRQRRAGSIRSRYLPRAPLPQAARSSRTAPNHQGRLVRATVEASERGMYLVIPAQIGDAQFLLARGGTERVGSEVVSTAIETEEASIIGFPLRRVPLSQGFNNLEFYYH